MNEKLSLRILCAVLVVMLALSFGGCTSNRDALVSPDDPSVHSPSIPTATHTESNPTYRWATWEKEENFSQIQVIEKPLVAKGMYVTFIDAGQAVALPDGRTAALELYIDPYNSEIQDIDGFLFRYYHYDFVFRLGDEVYPLNIEYPIYMESAYVAHIASVGKTYFDDKTFFLVIDRDGVSDHEIYKFDYNASCFRGRIEYIEPEYLSIGKLTSVLGTQHVTAKYTYPGAFAGTPVSSMLDIQNSNELTLLVDLDVHRISEDRTEYTPISLPAGTIVIPKKSNLIDLIIIADKEGTEYVITGYSHEQQSIKGVSIWDWTLFDGMNTAG